MGYIALYRKFRPQSFLELVGQEAVAKTLAKAVATENIVHAYLFCGPRGTGKTSVAKILAKAVNCENQQNGNPCGICAACNRIAAGKSLDIMEIDAASNRGIDEIRDLRERVKYAAATEKFKVYIIDEVHMLTAEAFNALLKTLEEPPAGVIFILATTEPHKIPLTVISRCQRFDFIRIAQKDIIVRLKEVAKAENIQIDEAALKLIAKKAQGGLRDALGLLDQCRGLSEDKITTKTIAAVLGTVDEDFLLALAENILKNQTAKTLAAVCELSASGKDTRQFLYDITDCFRELLQASPNDMARGQRILNILSLLSDTEGKLRFSLQPQTVLEISLLKCCGWQEAEADFPPIAPVLNPKMLQKNTGEKRNGTANQTENIITADLKTAPTNQIPLKKSKSATDKDRDSDYTLKEKSENIGTYATPSENTINKTTSQDLNITTAPSAVISKPTKTSSLNKDNADLQDTVIGGNQETNTITLSLERITKEWSQLLQLVKSKSITLNAFLQHSSPAALYGNRLSLDFIEDYAVHMNNILNKPNNKKLLEACLKQYFGQELTIEGRLIAASEIDIFPDEDNDGSLFD